MEAWLEQIKRYQKQGITSDGWEIQTIYQGRNTLYRLSRDREDYVVKAFGGLSLWKRLYYSYIGQSKAKRSYLYAHLLQDLDVSTPTPVAFHEEYNKFGLLGSSYYVCHYLPVEPHLHYEVWGWRIKPGLIEALAKYIAHLHQTGVEHQDLSPGNLPYIETAEGEYEFFLVDLNRISFHPEALSPQTSFYNLRRLFCSLSVGNQFALHYAKERGWSQQECMQGIRTQADRFFRKRNFKLSARYAKRELGEGFFVFLMRYTAYTLRRGWRVLLGKSPSRAEETFYHRYLMAGDIRGAVHRRFNYK